MRDSNSRGSRLRAGVATSRLRGLFGSVQRLKRLCVVRALGCGVSTAKLCERRLVCVRKFRVQVVFEASAQAEGLLEPRSNLFQASWGPGHVYSLLGPPKRGRRDLVVCAVVAAGSPDDAGQAVTDRACEQAAELISGSLRRRSVTVQGVSRWRRAGRVRGGAGEGDDGLSGDREPRRPVPPPGHLQAERKP